jgi:serine/threonine protein kinase
MISFGCPSCQVKLSVKPEYAGRSARCPSCKHPLTVPSPDRTVAYVAPQQIEGEESSLARIGHDGGVTLEHDPGGRKATTAQKPQRSVDEALATRKKPKERYVIESEIARGGMGAVLRAVDGDLRREVAIKYLLDEKDPKKRDRFIEEAQINAQLEHPNIVPVYDLRIDAQRRPYLMMKLVRGRDLKSVLDQLRDNPKPAEKEWPLGRLLNVFVNICNGLAFAHAHGVVHRDLKPANIMLGDFGEVYVMDWGLAKVLKSTGQAADAVSEAEEFSAFMGESAVKPARPANRLATSREPEADLTQEGSILGTPVYMSPEQAGGKVQAIDQRSDVYALGAILYEMLTLQPPVDRQGEYLEIIMRVAMGEIVPPEQREPQHDRDGKIPRELSAIAMKALAKQPEQRYANVELLRQDIERFQEGRSVSAKEDTRRELFFKFVKRNKGFSAGMAATFLVLVCSLYFIGTAWVRANQALQGLTAAEAARQKQGRDSVPALVRAARLLTTEKHFGDALTQLETALRFDEQDADAHLLSGQLLIGEQRYDEAHQHLMACLKVRPRDDKATPLAKICDGLRPDQRTKLLALAEELDRQKLFTISTRVTQQADKLQGPRNELLALYQKRIESAWPGLGAALAINDDGVHLNFDSQRERVRDLTPLQGMKLNWLNLNGCDLITDLSPLQGMPLKALFLNRCNRVQSLAPLKGMPLTTLNLQVCTQLQDFTPLQGLPLTTLNLIGCTQFKDLTPLQSMKLTTLNLSYCGAIKDLTPLQGMPLTTLDLQECGQVTSLAALQGMPLKALTIVGCGQVRDLTPLQGMPLTTFDLSRCGQVQSLAGLQGMKLTYLNLSGCGLIKELTPLQGMKLTYLNLNGCGLIKDLTPLQGMPLTTLHLYYCVLIKDLAPLQGMPLTTLSSGFCGQLKDLSPLKGMRLTTLDIGQCVQISDLAPLQGMPLTALSLLGCVQIKDLAPLQGMPLTTLNVHHCDQVRDLTPLKGMKLTALEMHNCGQVNDLTPLRGMPFTLLNLNGCDRVQDLTPLQGMNLTEVVLVPKKITKGMDALRSMKSLFRINGLPPAEFWKNYDAGEYK